MLNMSTNLCVCMWHMHHGPVSGWHAPTHGEQQHRTHPYCFTMSR